MPDTMCACDVLLARLPVRESGVPLDTWVPVVLVGVDVMLVVELELVELAVELKLELDVLAALDDGPDDPDTTRTTGAPDGWAEISGGVMTLPLPDLTTTVVTAPAGLLEPEPLPDPEPELPDPELPEPELPEPELPEPVDTGVEGMLATGVGVVATGVGVVTVVLPLPLPVLPVPVLPLPEPVGVGAELCVGCRPATGREIVPEVEWCTAGWPSVPCPTCASRLLRLLATAAGMPAAAPDCGLTTATEASPREEWEPGLGCAVNVCVAGEVMPPSLGHPL